MSRQKKQSGLRIAALVGFPFRHLFAKRVPLSAIILTAAIILTGCKKQPAEQTRTEHPLPPSQSEQVVESSSESAKPDTGTTADTRLSLNDIIKAARTWGPAYQSWYRKPAPDFTLTDITGKQHKLSDYRGKNVLLVFWGTWCPPCRMEIPDLIALRNAISEEKLGILAISNEKPDLVKKFVADQKINYTALLDKGNMPKPFGFMRVYGTSGVPCSFFIDSEGKIKFATAGLLSLGEIKAILQAE